MADIGGRSGEAMVELVSGGGRCESLAAAVERARNSLKSGNFAEAKLVCGEALGRFPDEPSLLRLLGMATRQAGDVEDAIRWFERALRHESADPDCRTQLSQLYRIVGRLDEAMEEGHLALAAQPSSSMPPFALGLACVERGEFDEAAAWLIRAIARDPEFAAAHLELGQLLLLRGEFRAGWIEAEWRYRLPHTRDAVPKFPAPQWNGMRLPQGKILLIGDQGYGDTIQFARFIPTVAERCREIIVGCSVELDALIATVPGASVRATRWEQLPKFDVQSTLSSLPGILGVELGTIPARTPYLRVDSEVARRWSRRIAASLAPGMLRVGLVWAGRPTHPNNARRSMRFADAALLAAVSGIALASLQKEVPDAERAALSAASGVVDLSPGLTTFLETAGAILALDVVVTIDSSVAHLAGALGKPVWVLLPRVPDWRWLLDRDDSPWYPTMRLFRQSGFEGWSGVVARVATELEAVAGGARERLLPAGGMGR